MWSKSFVEFFLFTGLGELPTVPIYVRDVENLYDRIDWQHIGARAIIRHFLGLDTLIDFTIEQCRYYISMIILYL